MMQIWANFDPPSVVFRFLVRKLRELVGFEVFTENPKKWVGIGSVSEPFSIVGQLLPKNLRL